MAHQLILSGKVQGVFCRDYCRQHARRMGLGGAATNLSDGRVQVIIEADDQDLLELYQKNLITNDYGFRFFGKIDNIEIQPYSGTVTGDYIF